VEEVVDGCNFVRSEHSQAALAALALTENPLDGLDFDLGQEAEDVEGN